MKKHEFFTNWLTKKILYKKVEKPPTEIKKHLFFLTKNDFSNFLQYLFFE